MALIFRSQGTYKQRQQGQEEDGGNFEKGHRLIREVWAAGESLRLPLSEVWAPLPTRTPPPVPLAKPSHGAAPCAGLHGWHLSWHRQVGESMGTEMKRARENHAMGAKSTPVTILHNRPATMETSEIVEIVTILHNPEISGLCALTHKSPMRLQTLYALMRLDA